MSADVIALDPVRLAALETYLRGLADGCRRRAGRIADELAGTGESAPAAVDLLERVAAWCGEEHLDVAWRRAVIEAMDVELPLTTIDLTVDEARADGVRLAERMIRLLDRRDHRLADFEHVMVEVGRRGGDPTFAAAFLAHLGASNTRDLRATLGALAGASAPDDPDGARLALQVPVLDLIRQASRATGSDALSDDWVREYFTPAPRPAGTGGAAPLPTATGAPPPGDPPTAEAVEAGLRRAGYGLKFASKAAKLFRAGHLAAVLGVGGGIVGLAAAPFALNDGDGGECDIPQAALGAAAGGLSIVAALTGGPIGLTVAAMALGAGSVVFSACEDQPERTNEYTLREDEEGRLRYPSGSASNPNVDGAGVPLDRGAG